MAKEKSLAETKRSDVDDSKPLRVRRGRMDKFDLYEISEEELRMLEKGAPADLEFNLGLFAFTVAVAAIVTLTSADFKSPVMHEIYLIVAVVGVILGSYFIFTWARTTNPIVELCKTIRHRLPPDLPVHAADAADEADEVADPPSAEDVDPPGISVRN
jgi:hypothetical protein